MKFGLDEHLEQSWTVPADVVAGPLRDYVRLAADGAIVDSWPMTDEIAAIVQAFVSEDIDVRSGNWFVESWCVSK